MPQTPTTESRVVSLVFSSLNRSAEFSSEERDWLAGWFVAAGQSGESLVQFLVRQQMLEPGVIPSVAMVEKGFLSPDAIRHFFGKDLADKLRNIMRERPAPKQVLDQDISANDTKRLLHTQKITHAAGQTATQFARSQPTVSIRGPGLAAPAQTVATVNNVLGEPEPQPSTLHQATKVKLAPAVFKQTSQPSSRSLILKPGMKLGKCLLTEQIGKEGKGLVFRAFHDTLNINVVVKTIGTSASDSEVSAVRLHQMRFEAKSLAKINHPHLIRIFAFDVDPEPYMVLECFEGWSLSELIHQAGALRYDRALLIVRQAAMALQAAYSSGIIHRDVKPANLLISRGGATKVANLGFVALRQANPAVVYGDKPVSHLAYMPPEQALNSKADFRSDIYSLGATFYHAVTGRTLFPSRGLAESMLNVVSGVPVSPAELAPGLDPLAVETILRMIAKDPAERFDNYEQLLDALNTLTERHEALNVNCTSTSEILIPSIPQQTHRGSEETATVNVAPSNSAQD